LGAGRLMICVAVRAALSRLVCCGEVIEAVQSHYCMAMSLKSGFSAGRVTCMAAVIDCVFYWVS